jgi:N-acetylmuramic acid 6-phosphate (MurNAc-6-P) etherase
MRVSEAPNELSSDIDVVSAAGLVRVLRQVDAQIFSGWGAHPGLLDAAPLAALERLATHVRDALRDPSAAVVLSGCGTSGRLAFFCARGFNHALREQRASKLSRSEEGGESAAASATVSATARTATAGDAPQLRVGPFLYTIAGGDRALIKSQESAEDDPQAGVRDLLALIGPADRPVFSRVVLIGISCGLSAAYVAGQLHYCVSDPRCVPCVLGFNPPAQARSDPVENWDQTFASVVSELAALEARDRAVLLCPVVGPEAITGSSRLKGGSATKMLLECVFLHATVLPAASSSIARTLRMFQGALRHTYLPVIQIASIVSAAADALRSGGRVYYLGEDALGIVGHIDASEQPPTFGADFGDIRGFVAGGWGALQNLEGDLSALGPEYCFGLDEFHAQVARKLAPRDLVVVLSLSMRPPEWADRVIDACSKAQTRTALVAFAFGRQDAQASYSSRFSHALCIDLGDPEAAEDGKRLRLVQRAAVELSLKWILNTVSTGAHVFKGQVFGNRMVNMRLSNNKLFFRAIGIVEALTGVDKERALDSVLAAIYADASTPDEAARITELRELPVSAHVAAAAQVQRVVPVAILLALGAYRAATDARQALVREPVVRALLQRVLPARAEKQA